MTEEPDGAAADTLSPLRALRADQCIPDGVLACRFGSGGVADNRTIRRPATLIPLQTASSVRIATVRATSASPRGPVRNECHRSPCERPLETFQRTCMSVGASSVP